VRNMWNNIIKSDMERYLTLFSYKLPLYFRDNT